MSVTRLASECPMCDRPLRRRNGKSGDFLACTGFPACKFTEDVDLSLDRLRLQLRATEADRDLFREERDAALARLRARS